MGQRRGEANFPDSPLREMRLVVVVALLATLVATHARHWGRHPGDDASTTTRAADGNAMAPPIPEGPDPIPQQLSATCAAEGGGGAADAVVLLGDFNAGPDEPACVRGVE